MRLGEGITNKKIINSYNTLLTKFTKKHGTKYDYSKVIFHKMLEKVIIICPIHGEFLQKPIAHADGDGCDKCSREESGRLRATTIDSFINKARVVHQDRYTYSTSDLIKNNQSKVNIECNIHGVFRQSVYAHLRGCGCPKCGDISVSKKTTKSLQSFLDSAGAIHNNKYDYSKIVWANRRSKIDIVCPTHGVFSQLPSSHLRGTGCPECAIDLLRDNSSIFIEKAKQVHGEKYDYSKVVYIQNKKKVDIICSIHGVFSQRCDTHLAGHGCPHCAKTIPPTERHENTPTYFYVVKYKGLYKVGICLDGARQRYRWDVDNIDDLDILTEITFEGYGKAYMFEQFLISRYFKHRYFGEQIFKNTGNTEVFKENIYEMYLKECADE